MSEDTWERLALLRDAMPNLPLPMLPRGRNTVSYTPYPSADESIAIDVPQAEKADVS